MVNRLRGIFRKKEQKSFGNPNGRPQIQLNTEKIIIFKRLGKSNRKIAKLFGVSEATIRRRLNQEKRDAEN